MVIVNFFSIIVQIIKPRQRFYNKGAFLSIENKPNNRLRDAAGLVLMGVVLFGGLYLLLGGGWVKADASTAAVSQSASSLAPGGILPEDIIVLRPGQEKVIGKTRLTYRGLEEGRGKVRLDVSLLELDPQVSYRHTIAIPLAKEDLTLAGLTFRLMAARPGYLQLRLIKVHTSG